MYIGCKKIRKPFFCTAKVTLVLIIANMIFLTYSYANENQFVNVVSARQEYLIKPIFQEFTKDTGIKVIYFISDANKVMNIIKSQGEITEVDAFLAVDASDLYEAQQFGILQPIRSRLLDRNIPSHLKDPSRQWFGLSLRVRSVIYNHNNINPEELIDYESIGDAKWKNKLAVRTSQRIYNKSMVAMMIAKYGYDKTKKIVKSWVNNFAMKPLESDVEVINKILDGKAEIGIVNSYYLAKMLKGKPNLPIKMHFVGDANGEVHVNISGMGVTRYAKRKENAIKLIEWLSSKKGQKLFANIDMEYPVNRKVKAHDILKKWGKFKQATINVKKAGELRNQAVKLMKEVGYE